MTALVAVLQSATALGRVGYEELVTALRLAEARGWIIKAPAHD
jgi:hypothetical protein